MLQEYDRIVFIEPPDDKWILPVSSKNVRTIPWCRHVIYYPPTARPLMYTSWAAVGNTQHDPRLFDLSTKITHRPHN
jgi:hypothetical protein